MALAMLMALVAPAWADGVLSPPEAMAAARAGKVVMIDVRTPGEWAETGIPAGARAVTWSPADDGAEFAARVLAAVGGDKAAPVALICRSGNRSAKAQAALRSQGFTRVDNIAEGMGGGPAGPGWLARGLPVQAAPAN
jgi:rhodanese-related sulfurtransferase